MVKIRHFGFFGSFFQIEKSGEKTKRKESGPDYGGFGEPIKKMTDEEYEKYLVDVKKAVFALKKIVAYANKVSQLANENDCIFPC